mmetsp:Transcript_19754/g.55122  ORF Transcript_19754/g.55122 Transcript_19754/m.55122 type:complete len:262 (-) Transcript_19754:1483-2268(-)
MAFSHKEISTRSRSSHPRRGMRGSLLGTLGMQQERQRRAGNLGRQGKREGERRRRARGRLQGRRGQQREPQEELQPLWMLRQQQVWMQHPPWVPWRRRLLLCLQAVFCWRRHQQRWQQQRRRQRWRWVTETVPSGAPSPGEGYVRLHMRPQNRWPAGSTPLCPSHSVPSSRIHLVAVPALPRLSRTRAARAPPGLPCHRTLQTAPPPPIVAGCGGLTLLLSATPRVPCPHYHTTASRSWHTAWPGKGTVWSRPRHPLHVLS